MSEDSWSDEQQIVQAWFATPPGEREPKTQRDLAKQLGLHEQTISRWKQQPEFQDAVTLLARRLLHEDLPAIYAALRNEAKAGSFQHIKLALQLAGEFNEVENAPEMPESVSLNAHLMEMVNKAYESG